MQPLLLGEDCPMRRQVKADRGRGSRDTLGGFYPIARLGQVCTRQRERDLIRRWTKSEWFGM